MVHAYGDQTVKGNVEGKAGLRGNAKASDAYAIESVPGPEVAS